MAKERALPAPPPHLLLAGLSMVAIALVGAGLAVGAVSGVITDDPVLYGIAGVVLFLCMGLLGFGVLRGWFVQRKRAR